MASSQYLIARLSAISGYTNKKTKELVLCIIKRLKDIIEKKHKKDARRNNKK